MHIFVYCMIAAVLVLGIGMMVLMPHIRFIGAFVIGASAWLGMLAYMLFNGASPSAWNVGLPFAAMGSLTFVTGYLVESNVTKAIGALTFLWAVLLVTA